MRTVLVTVSDDRFGRKNGQYRETQEKIINILEKLLPKLNFATYVESDIDAWSQTWPILQSLDPAINGRAYKPLAVEDAFDHLDYGDFLIYSDCSPEMWNLLPSNFDTTYSLEPLHRLCIANNGILSYFVKWDTCKLGPNDKGSHVHKYFTTDLCIDTMQMRQYKDCYQHAGGTLVLQKNSMTVEFVNKYLLYSMMPECSALGRVDGDYSFWTDKEDRYKMGHRHDQSITGLLVNALNPQCLDPDYAPPGGTAAIPHPYNFLNMCIHGSMYNVIKTNSGFRDNGRVRKGDKVKNKKGVVLNVFEVWPEGGVEMAVIGGHREAAFKVPTATLTKV